jgi:class 3 adenylate cyclase
MALEARETLVDQRLSWNKRQHELDFGIGIATGFATIGEIGFEHFSQYTVIGPVTNFAARLCSAAVNGQILISHKFLANTPKGMWQTEALGDLTFKGLERSASVYNVLKKTAA